jgi:hypothetical protein
MVMLMTFKLQYVELVDCNLAVQSYNANYCMTNFSIHKCTNTEQFLFGISRRF